MIMLMAVFGGLLGLVLGSFAGASVWRIRARQLQEDKQAGEQIDTKEYAKLKALLGRRTSRDRSRCLSCGHVLKWYDLIPIMSWVSTQGRCRYCNQPIGRFEPLIEIGASLLVAVFYAVWTVSHPSGEWWLLIIWTIILTLMVIAFAYDAKWFLLPDLVIVPLIILGLVIAGHAVIVSPEPLTQTLNTLVAVAILSILYLVLWLVSQGRWIGFGDVKLGLVLGLLLGDGMLAFLALFLANLIGLLIVLPGLMTKKLTRTTQVPFGPMLMLGFLIAFLAGHAIIAWYVDVSTIFTNWLVPLMV